MENNWYLVCTSRNGVKGEFLFDGLRTVEFPLYAMDKEDATKKALETLKIKKSHFSKSSKGWDNYDKFLVDKTNPNEKLPIE